MAYKTKQRSLLFDYFKTHAHSHISMREILCFARENGIGTATVYRYIDSLIQSGHLCKFNTEDGGACFQWRDADCTLYHFVCSDCGKCFHVDCPQLSAIPSHIHAHHAFSVDLSKTVFRGKCTACAERGAV